MKSALTAIIGRPSSGKSTLLNTMCGYKVSIVSPVPQTTRNRIRGIVTEPRGQLVFLDTPGFHLSDKRINLLMTDLVKESLDEADLILYIVDSLRAPGEEESVLLSLIAPFCEKAIVAVNKTDLAGSESTAAYQNFLAGVFPPSSVYSVSALQKTGTDELLSALFDKAPEGPLYYPKDFYTDQEPEFRISEIIREKVFNRMKEEIPHAVFIEIADMEEHNEGKTLWVRAFVHVERDSQKGILIGKDGSIIKGIRLDAEKELADIFPQKVHLDLRVKVSPKWRNNEKLLGRLIR